MSYERNQIAVSIVVFGRSANRLAKTIESLANLEVVLHEMDAEIIVACGDGNLTHAFDCQGVVPIRILSLPDQNETEMINAGVDQCKGELLLFFEEGACVDESGLRMHWEQHIDRQPRIVLGSVKTRAQREYLFFNNMSLPLHLWPGLLPREHLFHLNGVGRFEEFQHRLSARGIEIQKVESDMQWSTQYEENSPRQLKTVAIWISDRCNLPCLMCRNSILLNRKERRGWTLDEIKRIIDDAKSVGAECIELSEGEPTLWPLFADILNYATQQKMEVGFVTNGTNITVETAALIKASNVGDVPVSIDGPESIHDRIRGKNSFRRSMKGIECLKQHGVAFSIFTVVSKWTIDALPEMVELTHALGGQQISFQPISRNQSGLESMADPMFFSTEDIPRIKMRIRETIQASRDCGVTIRSPAMLLAIPEYVQANDSMVPRNGCTLPGRMAYIDRNRNLLTCFIPYEHRHYKKYEPGMLAEIWNSEGYARIMDRAESGACVGCLANCSDLEAVFGEPVATENRCVGQKTSC